MTQSTCLFAPERKNLIKHVEEINPGLDARKTRREIQETSEKMLQMFTEKQETELLIAMLRELQNRFVEFSLLFLIKPNNTCYKFYSSLLQTSLQNA